MVFALTSYIDQRPGMQWNTKFQSIDWFITHWLKNEPGRIKALVFAFILANEQVLIWSVAFIWSSLTSQMIGHSREVTLYLYQLWRLIYTYNDVTAIAQSFGTQHCFLDILSASTQARFLSYIVLPGWDLRSKNQTFRNRQIQEGVEYW